ncbi:MAG: translation initiation factor IF-2 [Actinomycetota bacterium]|nr:translation initiation factor IF-2 [Actinomycetota bacterium]
MRVHELAKELKKSNREIFDRLRKLGIDASSNFSALTQEDANRVRVSFGISPVKIEKEKKPKKARKAPAAKKATNKAEKKAAKPAAKKAKPAEVAPAKKKVKEKETKAVRKSTKAIEKTVKEKKVASKKATATKVAKKARKEVKGAALESEDKVAAKTKLVEKPRVTTKKQILEKAPEVTIEQKEKEKPEARLEVAGPHEEQVSPYVKAEKKRPVIKVAPLRKGPRPGKEKKVHVFKPTEKQKKTFEKLQTETVTPKLIRVPSGITVKEFSMKAGLTPGSVIKKMLSFGEILTINQSISDDTLKLLAEEFNLDIKIKASKVEELEEIVDRPEELEPRPPVVTVMGHVDHGKTLLLDTIRKADVISTEMGGITQQIGAYQVEYQGKTITFIDTPGHESFTAMRARGAEITDIAVLVVAADDGVMPQTLEALNHAREANVPIIVAVNKIDKKEADPYHVRRQLSEHGLVPEEWGGDAVFVDISAKEGTNINQLLEMILLVSELQELKANLHCEGSGVVIEAKLDRTRGPVATLLVKRGTIKIGDILVVGCTWGRIRAMFNERGEQIQCPAPSTPVEIVGLSSLPLAGDEFRVVTDEKRARQISDRRKMLKKLEEQPQTPKHISLESLFLRIEEGEAKQLKLVLKTDTQGSLEAVSDALMNLPQNEVKLNIIHEGVGGITETDVMLASASNAIVLGFNTRPDTKAQKAAEKEEIEIRTYQVIYKLTEDISSALKGMLSPKYEENITGRAEAREVFKIKGVGTVAGSFVLDGEIEKGSRVRVIRDGIVIYDGIVSSLRRFKEDVKSVTTGFECGICISDFQDIKIDDVFETYALVEIPR